MTSKEGDRIDQAMGRAEEYARLASRGDTARLSGIEATIYDLVGYSNGVRMVLPRPIADRMGRPFLAGHQ